MRLASLAMYVDPPPVRAATRQLWGYLRDTLLDAGLESVPDRLDELIAHDAAWLDDRLLLGQTCGYPYAKQLRGKVRLVATPAYTHAGADGPMNGSFIVVRAESSVEDIAGLRGVRGAINGWMSNSGMNLLRASVAQHAEGGRFFGSVIETGGHLASLAAIASGEADVAAIDCVTFGNVTRYQPEKTASVRILAETPKTPGLPLITRGSASDEEVAMLQTSLRQFANDPATAGIRDVLGLSGFELLPDEAYDRVMDLERQAVALGYPSIA